MTTPDARQRKRAAARWGGALAAVVLAAVVVRLALLSVMDVADLPGAGGVVALYRLISERPDPQPFVQVLRAARWLAGPDPVAAARLTSLVGSVAMVLGAAAGGAALDGRRGAVAAAGIAGVWSLALTPALLIGPDPITFGAAWLGAGLAWLGAASGGPGLVLFAAGIALVGAAATIKAVALPAVGLLLLAPLLCRHPRWLLAQVPILAAAAVLAGPRLAGTDTGPFESAALSAGALQAGWQGLAALPGRGLPEGALEQLVIAAAVGGLVPARGQHPARWLGQALLAAGVVVGLLALVGAMEPRTRPRYLTPLALGVVVLTGALASKVGSWMGRLGWLPAVAVVGLLSLDAWAWLHAWDAQRVALAGNAPAGIPAPPEAWQRRYARLALHTQLDLSVESGAQLVALVDELPGGVAIPPLRDERHRLLTVAASRAGTPSQVLLRRTCCQQQQALGACAAAVVSGLDAAGVALALPTQTDQLSRINHSEQAWLDALVAAASARSGLEARGGWRVRQATASGSPLPCRQGRSRPRHPAPN